MSRDTQLRSYFEAPQHKSHRVVGVVPLVAGALLLLVGTSLITGPGSMSGGCGMVIVVPGIIICFWGGVEFLWARSKRRQRLLAAAAGPRDEEVQARLDHGLGYVRDRSLAALGLSDEDLVSDLLTIVAPVLWSIEGVDSGDLLFRTGSDGCARFGVYSVAIIALTERQLSIFSCEYNFIRHAVLNEKTCEYHYSDIVSVSTGEQPSSRRLPSGERLTTVQEFRVSIPSGEAIRIAVDAPQIRRMTGAATFPASGSERAVQAIRAMLRQKKS